MTKTGERRRGAALQEALLSAAWDELASGGYSRFTIEGVAERAGTSRPVLYRRWANRHDLALAALRWQFRPAAIELPEGNTREQLIALLTAFSDRRAEVVTVVGLQMGEFFAEAQSSFAEVRRELLGGRHSLLDEILERGVARGEIDPARLTPRVRNVPVDLLRHELVMTMRPVPPEAIREIVDQVFLPLVQPER